MIGALLAVLLCAVTAPPAMAQPQSEPTGVHAPLGTVSSSAFSASHPTADAWPSSLKTQQSALDRPQVALPAAALLAQGLAIVETQAVDSARDGRYAEAIALTTQLLDREPDRVSSRLIRALSYYYSAQPPQALEDLDFALERAPAEGTGRTLRALAHLELGHYAEAVADAVQAASLPDMPTENLGAAELVLGRVLLARGQHAEAATYFRKVADRPDIANAHVARIALELVAAIPPPDARPLLVRDAGAGFETLELPGRSVRFQADDGVTAAGAAGVARLLDAQLAAIAAATGVTYSGPVQLVVYKSEWYLERAIGGAYRGPGLSRALRQGVRTGDGPWTQHLHISITNPSLLFDLTHEAVHLAQAEVGLDDAFPTIPAWLMEGQAEHLGAALLSQAAPHSVRLRLGQRTSGVVAGVRADRLQDLRTLERFGDWGRAQAVNAELTYGQAYYAVALLHERHGVTAPLRILHAVSTGWPIELAFQVVTGAPLDAFYREALDYTRRQVLSAQ
jgi:tetratricopeptide (TPR) repeat protein